MLLRNRSQRSVRGPVCVVTHRGKKDICSALKNTSLMWKGHTVWVEGCGHQRGGRAAVGPSLSDAAQLGSFTNVPWDCFACCSKHITGCSQTFTLGSELLHRRAAEVKYYTHTPPTHKQTLLRVKVSRGSMISWNPRGKANITPAPCAGQPQCWDRDLPSPTSVLSVCLEFIFLGSYTERVRCTLQLTAKRSIPLLLFKSWWQTVTTSSPPCYDEAISAWASRKPFSHAPTAALDGQGSPLGLRRLGAAGLGAGHQSVLQAWKQLVPASKTSPPTKQYITVVLKEWCFSYNGKEMT